VRSSLVSVTEPPLIQEYPPFVTSQADRERWDYSKGVAEAYFGDLGDEAVWGAIRAIFNSDMPTQ
jgi:hypothetical protein